MPKISIVLPTYNVEKYISRALNSCINQTLSDIEIIVVDDCGNDKSIEIAKEFASRDERIKIVKNPKNIGAFETRNEGVRHSSADYIMFLDPDDELELNACEIAFKKINENQADVVIFNAYECKNNDRKKIFSFDCDEKKLNVDEYKNNYKIYGWSMWNRLFTKEYFLKNIQKMQGVKLGGHMAEDFIFNYFITQFYNTVYILDKPLYKYYNNDNSVTKNTSINQIKTNIKTYNFAINIIKNHNYDDNFQQYCLNILKTEKIIYCANILKKIRFSNLEAFCLYVKYKFLKTLIKFSKKDKNA